ncbi:hypothetical protein E2I20_14810 [Alcaligenaceae bacterium SAGV3]|nr:hypothetical protein [Alcaligenaceae bacterium SAGV3]
MSSGAVPPGRAGLAGWRCAAPRCRLPRQAWGGLAISAGIVRDFGGSLRAYNREGGGAEFVLQLRPAKLEETVDA